MSDIAIHKEIYNSVADEYEARVKDLTQITKEAIDICSTYLAVGDSVLDIGCAVGLAVQCFNENGFIASGIELSDEMVVYARRRNPKSDIVEGDFLEHKFEETFNGIYMSAFIHLFPKDKTEELFGKIRSTLKSNGYIFLSTTKSDVSKEGWEEKYDYNKKVSRFRKHWTEDELQKTIEDHKFRIINKRIFTDPFDKTWMGFIARKID